MSIVWDLCLPIGKWHVHCLGPLSPVNDDIKMSSTRNKDGVPNS